MNAHYSGPLDAGGPVLLIGAGKMGGALLDGWLARGLDPASVFVVDPALPATYIARSNLRKKIVFSDYYSSSSVDSFSEPV
ncbi:hypothetical protein ACIKTA_11080, partial [Hansschlegelia beijingensis]